MRGAYRIVEPSRILDVVAWSTLSPALSSPDATARRAAVRWGEQAAADADRGSSVRQRLHLFRGLRTIDRVPGCPPEVFEAHGHRHRARRKRWCIFVNPAALPRISPRERAAHGARACNAINARGWATSDKARRTALV